MSGLWDVLQSYLGGMIAPPSQKDAEDEVMGRLQSFRPTPPSLPPTQVDPSFQERDRRRRMMEGPTEEGLVNNYIPGLGLAATAAQFHPSTMLPMMAAGAASHPKEYLSSLVTPSSSKDVLTGMAYIGKGGAGVNSEGRGNLMKEGTPTLNTPLIESSWRHAFGPDGHTKNFSEAWTPENMRRNLWASNLTIDLEKVLGPEKVLPEETFEKLARGIGNLPPSTPVFASNLLQAFEKDPNGKMSQQQALAKLTSPGVKSDELRWTGIQDFLKSKKSFTNQEIQSYIKAHQIEIHDEEVNEGSDWSGMQTYPGEQNYKVRLLTWGNKPGSFRKPSFEDWMNQKFTKVPYDPTDNMEYYQSRSANPQEHDYGYNPDHAVLNAEDLRDMYNDLPAGGVDDFTKSHWNGNPNVLAHVRTTDRMTPEGQKLLHIEEMQSDWRKLLQSQLDAQEDPRKTWAYRSNKLLHQLGLEHFASISKYEMDKFEEGGPTPYSMQPREMYGDKVPDAPSQVFDYQNLILKRMLRLASEEGYDGLSWTTGEEKYNLVKGHTAEHFDNLKYDFQTKKLGVYKNGSLTKTLSVDPLHLPDMVGEEAAKQIITSHRKELGEPRPITEDEYLNSYREDPNRWLHRVSYISNPLSPEQIEAWKQDPENQFTLIPHREGSYEPIASFKGMYAGDTSNIYNTNDIPHIAHRELYYKQGWEQPKSVESPNIETKIFKTEKEAKEFHSSLLPEQAASTYKLSNPDGPQGIAYLKKVPIQKGDKLANLGLIEKSPTLQDNPLPGEWKGPDLAELNDKIYALRNHHNRFLYPPDHVDAANFVHTTSFERGIDYGQALKELNYPHVYRALGYTYEESKPSHWMWTNSLNGDLTTVVPSSHKDAYFPKGNLFSTEEEALANRPKNFFYSRHPDDYPYTYSNGLSSYEHRNSLLYKEHNPLKRDILAKSDVGIEGAVGNLSTYQRIYDKTSTTAMDKILKPLGGKRDMGEIQLPSKNQKVSFADVAPRLNTLPSHLQEMFGRAMTYGTRDPITSINNMEDAGALRSDGSKWTGDDYDHLRSYFQDIRKPQIKSVHRVLLPPPLRQKIKSTPFSTYAPPVGALALGAEAWKQAMSAKQQQEDERSPLSPSSWK